MLDITDMNLKEILLSNRIFFCLQLNKAFNTLVKVNQV